MASLHIDEEINQWCVSSTPSAYRQMEVAMAMFWLNNRSLEHCICLPLLFCPVKIYQDHLGIRMKVSSASEEWFSGHISFTLHS